MRLQSLTHLVQILEAVARPQRVVVLGSSSLLVSHPELGEAGQPLELTTDADFLLEPVNEAIAESLHVAAGQDSAFMSQFGYHLDILRPAITETLPAGWEKRLLRLSGFDHIFALDPYDLALVKLVTGRPKDLQLLSQLLRLGILNPELLRKHYQVTPLGDAEAVAAGRNLSVVVSAS